MSRRVFVVEDGVDEDEAQTVTPAGMVRASFAGTTVVLTETADGGTLVCLVVSLALGGWAVDSLTRVVRQSLSLTCLDALQAHCQLAQATTPCTHPRTHPRLATLTSQRQLSDNDEESDNDVDQDSVRDGDADWDSDSSTTVSRPRTPGRLSTRSRSKRANAGKVCSYCPRKFGRFSRSKQVCSECQVVMCDECSVAGGGGKGRLCVGCVEQAEEAARKMLKAEEEAAAARQAERHERQQKREQEEKEEQAAGAAAAAQSDQNQQPPAAATTTLASSSSSGAATVDLPPLSTLYDHSLTFADILCSPDRQVEIDADMWPGMKMFFDNEIERSQRHFGERAFGNPMYLLGLGAISFLKAVLSLERADIDYAAHVLGAVDSFAAQLLPAEGAVASLGRWIAGNKDADVTNAELRLRVARAEANLLTGLMQLLQESYVSYIKAGFNLRAAWKGFEATERIVARAGAAASTRFDRNVLSGVLFGIGGVNLAVSQLPTKVLKLVSIFGIPHDRHEGFRSLRAAAASGGFHAPLANLIMAGYYALIPSFAPCLVESYLREGLPLLQSQLDLYPVSAIHWWLGGRMLRLRRDPRAAIAAFRRSAAGGQEFEQVRHVNAYEIGVSRMALADWRVASDHFGLLFAQSTWSRAMYRYMQAACAEALGHRQRAVELAKQVPGLVDRTYGGRVLSVEQFVIRRVKAYEARGWSDLFLIAIELVYTWNLFPQTTHAALVGILNTVRRHTEEAQLFAATGSKVPALLYRVGDELRHGRHPTIPGVDRPAARRFFAALTARYPNSTAGAQAYEALAQMDEEDATTKAYSLPPDGAAAEAASVADMDDEPGTEEEVTARLRASLDNALRGSASVGTGSGGGGGGATLLRGKPLLYVTEAEARSVSSHTLLARWDTAAAVHKSAAEASALIERLAVAWAIEASLLAQLGEEADAATLYERLGRLEKAKVIREEKHVFPFAAMDRATYAYAAGRRDEALTLARHVYSSYSDYNFEYRLLLRCHLLIRHMEDNVDEEQGKEG
eukprot:CAMPEP_0170742242 /NCGR_PEP_ID=MMETSP0437-20130122/6642_1 /TAXON_ID=0 /ORGANISM="Sexangularia sp." /LENGTH=1022 /DNA_ID=CAMNT_0011080855 /DNA_START=598 /DNA_END=3666 /DNA_ORIENTATION=-